MRVSLRGSSLPYDFEDFFSFFAALFSFSVFVGFFLGSFLISALLVICPPLLLDGNDITTNAD
jgi:hypothetical protein